MRRRDQPILHEELRHGSAAEHGLRHGGDELVQATAAPAQRLGDRVRVLDEAGAALALAAEAGLAVDDQRTERPFGGVVRRLDALDVEEGPHRGFGPQDSAAHRRRLVPPAARALVEQPDHLRSNRPRPSPCVRPCDLPVSVEVPDPEERVHQSAKSHPDPAVLLLALGHPAEVADDVSEAHLSLLEADVAVDAVAVGDEDAGGHLADELLAHVAAARGADQEHRRLLSDTGPRPRDLVGRAPGRFIQVLGGRFQHGIECFRVRRRHPLGQATLHVRDRAERHVDAVRVRDEALGSPSRQPVLAGEQANESGQVRTKAALMGAGRERGAAGAAARGALEPVEFVLDDVVP